MRTPKVTGAAIALALVGLAFLGCGGGSGEASVGPSRAPAALILVTIDGLRAGDAGEMKNLDALGREGLVFRDVWTTCPMTRPAVATYLTGRAPDRHGVRDDRLGALAEDVPTLAEVLRTQGYATAAFPDSSFLGTASGLLRGFDLVDDPPPAALGPLTWLPLMKRPVQLAEDFEAYLASRPSGGKLFAWIHLSVPLAAQLLGPEAGKAEQPDASAEQEQEDLTPTARVDEALGSILRALEARVPASETAVIVAGTLADVGGDEDEMPGPGFSLDERAIRVTVVTRFPAGTRTARSAESLGWSPDVPVTLASLAGAVLPGAEGRTLLEEPETERVVFAWSWAPRDQLGWRPLRAGRRASLKRLEGDEDRTIDLRGGTVDAASPAVESLVAALAERGEAPPTAVPLEPVRGLLEARGLVLDPVPERGRDFGPAAARVAIGRALWHGRRLMRFNKPAEAIPSFEQVLVIDPQNLAGRLSLGQYQSLTGQDALKTLRLALERYPSHPDLLHWWAHGLWVESPDAWKEAEVFLRAILPFDPHNGDLLYDLACTRSLAGDCQGAGDYLRSAIQAGYQQWEHIETDSDLRNLRECGGFAEVLREFRR